MAAAGPWIGPHSIALETRYQAGAGGLLEKEGLVGRLSAGKILVGSTAAIADAKGIITQGADADEDIGMHRGRVRAIVGEGGWTKDDPLTVDTDGTLITADPETDVVVAYAQETGIEDQSAWTWWPIDNQQIAPSGS